MSKFLLGMVVATANAERTLVHDDVLTANERHSAGDWGEVDKHDRRENELALRKGFRLLSAYRDRNVAGSVLRDR